MMYDELVGDLMAQATHFHFNDETSLLLLKAADAIEDLIVALTASNEVIAKSKQQHTNAARIRSMTDEELAEMLNHAQGDGYLVGIGQRKMSAYGNWLEWLQQESDGE